ncbi:MAG: hypothetical protein AABX33_07220 [Nanoarchaeota archaeon]
MNKKILIIVAVVLVVLILALIPIISIAGNADVHPKNLFIAAKIMKGNCRNGICEIDEIISTEETKCYTSNEPPQQAVCAIVTQQKVLCEQDCKKPEPTTKPDTD